MQMAYNIDTNKSTTRPAKREKGNIMEEARKAIPTTETAQDAERDARIADITGAIRR